MQAVSSCMLSLSLSFNVDKVHRKHMGHCESPWNEGFLLRQIGISATKRRNNSIIKAVEYLPAICPHILIREAQPEDYWEVAETHCSSFFPNHGFPMDLVLRADRLVAMFSGFSIPQGCRRKCLVAIDGRLTEENHFLQSETLGNTEFGEKFGLNSGRISGILTIDTVADFLPRRGPLGLRSKFTTAVLEVINIVIERCIGKRTGIAYISNVAVQQKRRRRGIARRLVVEAETVARAWGCRSIALHCDVNNPAAVALYRGQGFRCVKVPQGAKWPHPKTAPDSQFHFMMKLLPISPCS